ncbi:autotransporter outer membrane beta-barrel domain-containing protein [uncultured Sutterella sp.]|uniref:autotransporter family protein n=1 Tax=uncultured Sutterella sp. TaxID=286133 RepID=UPI0026165F8B|nr:autotransporter outer membrane beta-barrel domain-containing protein [uncultured Sutterella sp.]
MEVPYKLNNLYFGESAKVQKSGSSVTVNADGTLTVANLEMRANSTLTNNGVVTITGKATAKKGATYTDNNDSALVVNVANLVTEKDGKYTATEFGSAVGAQAKGLVIDKSLNGTYTLETLKGMQTAIVGEKGTPIDLIFENAVLQSKDGKNYALSDVNGYTSYGTTVTVDTAAGSVTKDTAVGAVAFDATAAKEGASLTATSSATLALLGDAQGNVVTGVAADKKLTLDGKFEFGAQLASVKDVALNVANDIALKTSSSLTLGAAEMNLKGIEAADNSVNITVAENSNVVADYIYGGNVTVEGGSLAVTGQYNPDADVAPAAEGGSETPTYDKAFALQTSYKVVSSDNQPAVITFGEGSRTYSAAAVKKANYVLHRDADDPLDAVLVVNQRLDLSAAGTGIALGTNGTLTVNGSDTTTTVIDKGLNVQGGSSTAVLIDVAGLASHNYAPKSTDGVFKVGAQSYLDNVILSNLTAQGFKYDDKTETFSLKLGDQIKVFAGVKTDADFYETGYDETTGTITVKADQVALDELKTDGFNLAGQVEQEVKTMTFSDNAISHAIIFGGEALDAYWNGVETQQNALREELVKLNASYASKDLDAILDMTAKEIDGLTNADEKALVKQIIALDNAATAYTVASENAATNMAVLGGAFSTAMDVQEQVNKAVARRTSVTNLNAVRGEVGVTPWVDVFGTTNEAKRLYGSNAGYEADIYGAVLGFDYTAACGGVLGLALNVGTADGNSVGNGVKVDNDVDFYGVSIYAAKQFGGFNVQADAGYTQTSNDLSTNGAFGNIKESLDADIYTFGLGTEYKVEAGIVNITPHAGFRLTSIDMDDSKYGADYDRMTVYQLPLGVAFSGTVEANGWKVAPMVDVSVVPTFGDKDAVASFIGKDVTTRVVDSNPVQATLGVNAQNGAFTFGLNYSLSAGSDDRMNNSFNANVRYAF